MTVHACLDCAEAYQLYQFSQSVELPPEQSDVFESTASGSPVENSELVWGWGEAGYVLFVFTEQVGDLWPAQKPSYLKKFL